MGLEMKVPHWISESEMLNDLNSYYAMKAENLSFIPIGDMSYAYKVICSNDTIYFLKI